MDNPLMKLEIAWFDKYLKDKTGGARAEASNWAPTKENH